VARRYFIKRGDTLGKIAKKFYGDHSLFSKLGKYNGILNPKLIVAGQTIEIPSKKELVGVHPKPLALNSKLFTPHGLEEIIATFGNVFEFIRGDGNLDPRWESENLCRTPLPFSIPLSWDQSKVVKNIYCHVKLKEIFPEVFESIKKKGLKERIRSYGGCFNYRSKRTSGKLSTHCWGISIDLNPETNAQGKQGTMHRQIVEIFREHGFKWGGDWTGKSKDPMHFQFCSGY
jgi:LysM repeat protein